MPLWGALGNEPNKIECLKLLLASPVINPDIPEDEDEAGDTPLHEAIRNGYEESIRLLVLAGAKIDLKNTQENLTAYELASPEMKVVINMALQEKRNKETAASDSKTPSTDLPSKQGSTVSVLQALGEGSAKVILNGEIISETPKTSEELKKEPLIASSQPAFKKAPDSTAYYC